MATTQELIQQWLSKYGSNEAFLWAVEKQYWKDSSQYNIVNKNLTPQSQTNSQQLSQQIFWWEKQPETKPVSSAVNISQNLATSWLKNVTPTPMPSEKPAPTQTAPTPTKVQVPTQTSPATPETKVTKTITPTSTPADIQGRQQEIVNNLNTLYWANDQDLKTIINSGDYEKFKSRFPSTNPDEAKVVDAFYQAHQPKTSDSFFNILATGQKIENKQYQSTPEAASAQHRWDIVSPFKWASTDNLYTWMINGKIVPWSESYNDLIKANWWIETPEMAAAKVKYQEKVNADVINWSMDSLIGKKSWFNTTQDTTDNVVKTKWIDYAKEFQQDILNNPELISLSQQVSQTDKDIADLEAKSKNILKDIEAKHPWISTWLLYEIAAEQQAPINEQLTLMYNQRNKQASDLNYKTELTQKMFDYKVAQQQQEEQRAYEVQKLQEERTYEQQKLQESRTYTEQQKQKELKQQFDYTYWDLKSTNPQIQKTAALRMAQAIQTQYAGMPFRRTVDVMADDIIKEINAGKTTDQITTDITNAIQNAPAYKEWATNKWLIEKPAKETDSWAKLSDTTLYNQKTGQTKTVSWQVINADTSNYNTSLLDTEDWTKLSRPQCWMFVNDVLWTPSKFWDSLASKTKNINSSTPAKWWVIIMSSPWKFSANWHVWIITDIQWDNIIVKDSNYNGDSKVMTHNIKINDPRIQGYYIPWTSATWTRAYDQLTPEQKLQADSIGVWIYGKRSALKPEQQDNIAKQLLAWKTPTDISKTTQDFAATQAYTKTLNGSALTKLRSAINFTSDSLWLIDSLNKEAEDKLKRSWITNFAKVQKSAALQWLYWQEVKSVFTRLDSQIWDLVSELATVYKWGNSSTDASLKQADKMLSSDWDYQTLKDNVELVRKNLEIRKQSLNETGVATSWNVSTTKKETTKTTPTVDIKTRLQQLRNK